jgi:hypothetical protein
MPVDLKLALGTWLAAARLGPKLKITFIFNNEG